MTSCLISLQVAAPLLMPSWFKTLKMGALDASRWYSFRNLFPYPRRRRAQLQIWRNPESEK